MHRVRLFGLLEHVGFYFIVVFSALFLLTSSLLFIWLSIASWAISFLSHIMESLLEKKGARKILVGI